MQIQARAKGFGLGSELQDEVIERIERALDRYRNRIRRVNVFFEDVNGPKKGVDKAMRLIIDLERLSMVVVEETGESWQALMDLAVERAAQTVGRHIDRRRTKGDRTPMAGDPDQAPCEALGPIL